MVKAQKLLSFLFCMILMFSLCACGSANEPIDPSVAERHQYPKTTVYNGYDFYDNIELDISAEEYLEIANARYGEVSEIYTSPCYDWTTKELIPNAEAKLVFTRLYNEADDSNTYIGVQFLNDKLTFMQATSMIGCAGEKDCKEKLKRIFAAQEYPRRNMKQAQLQTSEWSGRNWYNEDPKRAWMEDFFYDVQLPYAKATRWEGNMVGENEYISADDYALGTVYSLETYKLGYVGRLESSYSKMLSPEDWPQYSFEIWHSEENLMKEVI